MAVVFLDMDGVLVDFIVPAMRLVPGYEDFTESDLPEQWDVPAHLGIPGNEFWKAVDAAGEAFWADSVRPYPWAISLYTRLSEFAKVYIATSPSRDPSCFSGKCKALHKLFGPRFDDIIFISDKYLLAGPGRALVDDKYTSVQQFTDFGGSGILFPHPCNSRRCDYDREGKFIDSVVDEVRKAIERSEPWTKDWR